MLVVVQYIPARDIIQLIVLSKIASRMYRNKTREGVAVVAVVVVSRMDYWIIDLHCIAFLLTGHVTSRHQLRRNYGTTTSKRAVLHCTVIKGGQNRQRQR